VGRCRAVLGESAFGVAYGEGWGLEGVGAVRRVDPAGVVGC
jgi:hypothetical protein